LTATPKWEFEKETTKNIEVVNVNLNRLKVDAIDLDCGMPVYLDATKEVDLSKVDVGEAYMATVKVYRAPITPQLEKQWMKTTKDNPELLKGIELMKNSGEAKPLYKFEIISLAPLTISS